MLRWNASGALVRENVPRLIIICAGVVAGAGYFIASRLAGSCIFLLYVAYGFMGGIGIGASYNQIITMVNSWFPEKRGLSGGILMMSFGISTMVLGKAAERFFAMEAVGWRNTYLIIGVVICLLMLIAAFVLKFPAEGVKLPSSVKGKVNNISSTDYTPLQMMRRRNFWFFFIALVLMSFLGSGVISTGKELIISIGASPEDATTIVGILSISNGLGRVLIGFIFDKVGFIRAKLIAGIANILGGLCLVLAVVFSSVPVGVAAFCLAGASYGSCPTLESFMCSAFYGIKYFSINMAIINMHLMLASIAAPFVTKMHDITSGYLVPAIIIMCCTVVSFILNMCVRKA